MIEKKDLLKTCFTASFVSAVIVLVIFVFVGILPFGNTTVLTGDLKGNYVPLYSWLQRWAEGEANLGYSFSKSLGGGMYAHFAFYPVSLYMLFLPLFKGASVAVFAEIALVLKIMFAAGAMTYYLGTLYISDRYLLCSLGVCYSAMTYTFAYAQNTMWIDNVALLPVCLCCLEILIKKNRAVPFVMSVFAVIIRNYYTGYMICIYCAFFFIVRLIVLDVPLKESAGKFIRFALSGILGAAMSGVILIPTLAETAVSKGIGQNTGVFRFGFSFDLLKFARQFVMDSFSWDMVRDKIMPFIWCGTLPVAAFIIFLVSGNIERKKKNVQIAAFVLLLVSLWINPVNICWHMLREPVWFPFRQSFLVSASSVIIAAQGLQNCRLSDRERKTGLTFLLFFSGYIFVAAFFNRDTISLKCVILTFVLMCVFGWLLVGCKNKKIAYSLVIVITAAELALNGVHITDTFEKYSYNGLRELNQTMTEAVEIYRNDSGDFVRMEKTAIDDSINDPLRYGYKGLNYFNSIQDTNPVKVLELLGYKNPWNSPKDVSPAVNSFMCVKYIMSNDGTVFDEYIDLGRVGQYELYENPYVFPAAVLCDRPLSSQMKGDTPEERIDCICSEITGEKISFGSAEDFDYGMLEECAGKINARAVKTVSTDSSVKMEFDNSGYKSLLLIIPDNPGLKCTVNGKAVKTETVFDGLISVPVESGHNDISLEYHIPFLELGIAVSSVSLIILAVLIIPEKKRTNVK